MQQAREFKSHWTSAGAAVEIAIRAKRLKRCADCDEVVDVTGAELVDCYKLGNYLITHGDPVVEPFDGNRLAMTDAVNEAVAEAGEWCRCKRMWAAND